MTSRIKVDMRLCSHSTVITAKAQSDGSVMVSLESDCEDIQHYNKLLQKVSPQDYTDINGSKIISLASEAGMTPTCLIPVGVFNACWMEVGMISKNLAKDVGSLCMHFLD